MKRILPSRYNRDNLYRLMENPRLLLEEVQNLHRSSVRFAQNQVFNATHGEPFDVMAEDWDNLVLLDACRLDFYREHTPFDSPINERLSRGSGTPEFLRENFHDESYHDTVYVSSNPYVPTLSEDTFHEVIPLLDEWDENWGTVMPADVTAAAREAASDYPDKRLIIHYMQPHTPHIGPTAEKLRAETPLQGWDRYHVFDEKSRTKAGVSIWTLARRGGVSIETVRQSYRETLEIVFKSVDQLASEIDGKTVVSADHGEMLGERLLPFSPREFGHTTGLLTEELRRVPWQVVSDDKRRDVTSDPPRESQEMSDEETERRLQALGYVS